MPRINLREGLSVKVKGPRDDHPDFLEKYDDWCEEWVRYVLKEDGVEAPTDDHWKVINAIREYYEKNGVAPMVRVLSEITGLKLKHIYELFPSGPNKGACKAAGLPSPVGCF